MAIDRNYIKLGQLYTAIQKLSDTSKYHEYKNKIFNILNSDYDVNYKVHQDSYLSRHSPQFKGYTALHFAVTSEDIDIVNFLLDRNADFTIQPFLGFTPLRLALELMKNLKITSRQSKIDNLKKIITRLLHAHIERNNITNPFCDNSITHFHIASMNDFQATNFYINFGIDVNHMVLNDSFLFPGFTALHFAVLYGQSKTVKVLLENGADVDLCDENGMTPLQLLVDCNIRINDCWSMGILDLDEWEHFVSVEVANLQENDLIMNMFMKAKNTSPQDGICNRVDETGLTYLHACCTRRDQSYTEMLLDEVANINEAVNMNARFWPGYTPLHFAARCNLQTVMLLLDKGANLSAKDANGITPFDLCVERYSPAELSRILQTRPQLCGVNLSNEMSLADVLRAMDIDDRFDSLLSTIDIDARIPFDSELWPGYTLIHLAVMLSRTKKKYDRSYCVVKGRYWEREILEYVDNDSLVKTCLWRGPDLTLRDARGMTALELAFRLRKTRVLGHLLSSFSNALPWTSGQDNLLPYHLTCVLNNGELMKKFLYYGLEPKLQLQSNEVWYNKSDVQDLVVMKAGSTLFHTAALFEATEILEICKEMGFDVAETDADGFTPTQLAFIHNRSRETLKLLLSFPEAQNYNFTNSSGLSHLHIACYAGATSAVEELLKVTYDVNNQINIDPNDSYAHCLERYAGFTPLHFAVESCSEDIVNLLLEKDANIRLKCINNKNPLHWALQNLNKVSIIRLIATKLMDQYLNNSYYDDYNITRLHIAYATYDQQLFRLALEAGDRANDTIAFYSPLYKGDTPLHLLMRNNNAWSPSTINPKFFEHNSDLTLQNCEGLTPLLVYEGDWIEERFPNIFSYNLDRFCSVNPKNSEGLSHFHICCFQERVEVVQRFLNRQLDIVNTPIDYFVDAYAGYTPLHIAVLKDNIKLIKLLLNHGADVLCEDADGNTPLHLAMQKSRKNFIKLLNDNEFRDDTVIVNSVHVGSSIKATYAVVIIKELLSIKATSEQLLASNVYGGRINFTRLPFSDLLSELVRLLDSTEFSKLMVLVEGLNDVDDDGCNAIFKFFFNPCKIESNNINHWVNNVNNLLKAGCELDHQSNDGSTALHKAVRKDNEIAVTILLALGADVNIVDDSNRVACEYIDKMTVISQLKRIFFNYMTKLKSIGSYLTQANLDFIDKYSPLIDSKWSAKHEADLMLFEELKYNDSLSMRDLLTDRMLTRFPRLSTTDREGIANFLTAERHTWIYENWIGIFRFQQRQMLARNSLISPARTAIFNFTGLPLLIVDAIIKSLPNHDLKTVTKI